MRVLIFVMCAILLSSTVYAEELTHISGEHQYNSIVTDIVNGNGYISPVKILSAVADMFIKEIRECTGEIVMLIVIAIISGALNLLSDNRIGTGNEAAFFCCFTVMSALALNCFNIALQYGRDVIGAMTTFITKLSPVLMMLMIACGNTVSASAFHPVLSSAIYVVGILVEKVMIPLCVFGALIAVSGNIGGENRISGLCRTVTSVNKWIMTAVITVFTGISTIYGFSAPSLDAVTAKTMKFAAGTLVPVVGGFLSDTLETIISGSRLMKNAVGTAGVIMTCIICLIPILKIGAIHLMLRIAGAITEPVADKRISTMLADMSSAVGGIFALTVMSAVLFVLNLCIILAATN